MDFLLVWKRGVSTVWSLCRLFQKMGLGGSARALVKVGRKGQTRSRLKEFQISNKRSRVQTTSQEVQDEGRDDVAAGYDKAATSKEEERSYEVLWHPPTFEGISLRLNECLKVKAWTIRLFLLWVPVNSVGESWAGSFQHKKKTRTYLQ